MIMKLTLFNIQLQRAASAQQGTTSTGKNTVPGIIVTGDCNPLDMILLHLTEHLRSFKVEAACITWLQVCRKIRTLPMQITFDSSCVDLGSCHQIVNLQVVVAAQPSFVFRNGLRE
jgi:hypothetical protein